MPNPTRGPKLGDLVYITMGDWADHYGVVRDVYRGGKAKVAIKGSIAVIVTDTRNLARADTGEKVRGN